MKTIERTQKIDQLSPMTVRKYLHWNEGIHRLLHRKTTVWIHALWHNEAAEFNFLGSWVVSWGLLCASCESCHYIPICICSVVRMQVDQKCLLLRVKSTLSTGRSFLECGGAGGGKEGSWQRDHSPGTCTLEYDPFLITRSSFLKSCISIILVDQGRQEGIKRMILILQLLEHFSSVFYSNI